MERNYNLSDLEKNFDKLLAQELPTINFARQLNDIHYKLYNGKQNN